MSWNIKTPGDYINGPLTVVGVAQFNSNVGVGVAPSAWNSNYNAIDIGANGSIAGRLGASNTVDVVSNAFRNSSGNWVYKFNGPASRYQADGSTGAHFLLSAATGTAGATISWVTALALNLNGALALNGGNAGANGVGIAFPSAQSASTDANTLDDYEEGTWTPTYVGTTGGTPTVATTYARYTKVGRLVTASFQITITNVSTATGYFAFSLPFASDSSGQCGAFRETAVLGQMGMVTLLTGSQVILSRYDNGNVLVNNYTFVGTFSYIV